MTAKIELQNKTLTIPALKCHQQDFTFYAFVLTAEQLVEISYVSRREGEDGYQRLLDLKRAQAIKKYIEAGQTLPNNIILNFNDSTQVSYSDEQRTIKIPFIPKSAWIIDGQHRLYGADILKGLASENNLAKNYQFLVSAFVGLRIIDQAKIFLDINSYQKGVSKSLLYDLTDIMGADEEYFYINRASDIIRRLNEDPESPFYNKISLIENRVRDYISLSTFVDALTPHIETGGVLSHTNEYKFTLEKQYGILKNYFNAIRDTSPELWFNDKSLLTKTTGLNALMLTLPTVFKQTVRRYDSFELQYVKEIISWFKTVPWTGKELKGQQGKIAAKTLAENLGLAISNYIHSLEDESQQKKDLAI
jgi:DNA sulfur modification protein DndB